MEKIAVLAPIPSASDRTATAVTIGRGSQGTERIAEVLHGPFDVALARGWPVSAILMLYVVASAIRIGGFFSAEGTRIVQLEGVYSVLPTPFTPRRSGRGSLRKRLDLFIGAGVNGVTALGVTGEVARLDDDERRRVLEVVVEHVNGRIGVVAGTTAEGTRTCIGYSRHAKAAGATAVMVSPPRMPKLNSEAVVRHYRRARRGGRHRDRGPGLSADFWLRDGAGAARADRAGDRRARARSSSKIRRRRSRRRGSSRQAATSQVRIFGGLGGVFLLEELMAGATGAMTGFAFPEILVKIVSLYRAGKVDEAADVFYRAVPLMRFEFQEGIGMAIRKEVLHRRGALASPATRAPAAALDKTTREALDRVMEWVERRLRQACASRPGCTEYKWISD